MSRALVTLAPIDDERSPRRAEGRARADFVAHLIATSVQAPQTCARRRAGPQEAVAAYDALGHWPTRSGGVLSRSL